MIDLYTIGIGFFLKIVGALIAWMVLRYSLTNLDKATGLDFKQWVKDSDVQSKSIYLSFRILAIAILFGSVL